MIVLLVLPLLLLVVLIVDMHAFLGTYVNFANNWINDSRCSNHFIGYREIFNPLHDYILILILLSLLMIHFILSKVLVIILSHNFMDLFLLPIIFIMCIEFKIIDFFIKNHKKNNTLFYLGIILWRFMLILKLSEWLLLKKRSK